MGEDDQKVDELLRLVRDLKKAEEPKAKDGWDKASVLLQVMSGVVLVIVGFMVTCSIDSAQQSITEKISQSQIQSSEKNASAQIDSAQAIADAQIKAQQIAQQSTLDATNRQIASDYLGKLTAAGPADRLRLLEALDVELGPRYSVPLAVRFTRPVQVRASICNAKVTDQEELKHQNEAISNAAFSLLRRLRREGEAQLLEISRAGSQPDAGIAGDILGKRTRVLFRVSQIDDFADVYLNSNPLSTYQFGHESGWVDVTDRLNRHPNYDNSLYVMVRNSPYEGTGVRLEIRAGAEQYDRIVYRYDWTGEGPAFGIGYSISMDKDGNPHLNGDNIQVQGPKGEPHCP